MYKCKIPVLLVVFAVFSGFVQAQEIQRSKGHFSGSLETNWGFYMKDDKLGANTTNKTGILHLYIPTYIQRFNNRHSSQQLPAEHSQPTPVRSLQKPQAYSLPDLLFPY